MMARSRVTRLSAAAGSVLAGIAVTCAAATVPAGAHVGAAARAGASSTVYVSIGSTNWGAVRPVSTATNTAGPAIPITLGRYSPNPSKIAITPDGKTAYVLSLVPSRVNNNRDILTPISTAADIAGTPVSVGKGAWAIAISP